MEKEFVGYTEALVLKELGFDEPCFTIFLREEFRGHIGLLSEGFPINSENNNIDIISAPLYQQAFRWLYEKLDIEKGVIPLDNKAQHLLLKKLIEIVKEK